MNRRTANGYASNRRVVQSDFILLLTAVIWGFAFTAQRAGMEHIGPFLYNGIRFALGAVVLVPVWLFRKNRAGGGGEDSSRTGRDSASELKAERISGPAVGIIAGVLLFAGVSFQQVGIVHTTAGKAGFITGLYVVLVPIIGSIVRRKTSPGTWVGAFAAAAGLYLLSVRGSFRMSKGDLLVCVSAFFWAIHVLVLARYAAKVSWISLAVGQYVVCAAASFVVALFIEPIRGGEIIAAIVPIVYGGALSVGVAYTLQIVGQRYAPPSHAAIILSLEGAFAAVGGFLILGEVLKGRELSGCVLMLCGMLISQFAIIRKRRRDENRIG